MRLCISHQISLSKGLLWLGGRGEEGWLGLVLVLWWFLFGVLFVCCILLLSEGFLFVCCGFGVGFFGSVLFFLNTSFLLGDPRHAGHFTKRFALFIKARATCNSHNRNNTERATVKDDAYILTEKNTNAVDSLPGRWYLTIFAPWALAAHFWHTVCNSDLKAEAPEGTAIAPVQIIQLWACNEYSVNNK